MHAQINDTNLTKKIFGYNENLKKTLINVIEEKPLTLYLNAWKEKLLPVHHII